MELLVHLFHEVGQLDLVLVALLNQHLFVRFNHRSALILHFCVLVKQRIDLILGLIVHFIEFNIVMLTVKRVLHNRIRAERLLARLAIEEHF